MQRGKQAVTFNIFSPKNPILILRCFIIRKLFQSTSLYIKGILSGRPATLCMVKGGNVRLHSFLQCVCYVCIEHVPVFLGSTRSFCSFRVTHVSVGNFYKKTNNLLKMLKGFNQTLSINHNKFCCTNRVQLSLLTFNKNIFAVEESGKKRKLILISDLFINNPTWIIYHQIYQ